MKTGKGIPQFLVLIGLVACACLNRGTVPGQCTHVNRHPCIRPDYTDLRIPPNIAPLNFRILEKGTLFTVRIHGIRGDTLRISSEDGRIRIPPRAWRRLLESNRGEQIVFESFVRDGDRTWNRYAPFVQTIALERIDSHIAYRPVSVIYNHGEFLSIRQFDLERSTESLLFGFKEYDRGCVNCHTFLNNDPTTFFLHLRHDRYGSGALICINNRPAVIASKFGYTTWHPGGKLAVYSINRVRQCFDNTAREIRDAYDLNSGFCVYDVEKQCVSTVPQIAVKDSLETWPCWAPDGRYLYFCRAPILWKNLEKGPPENLDKCQYGLFRVPYDAADKTWGTVETVLSPRETGLSITEPRVSPDGRHILLCMHRFGPSPYLHAESDLYLMDVTNRRYWRLGDDVNSLESESWHCWSSNGRWIAFTSKRGGGIFGRVYLSYFDTTGKTYKAFVMPQRDPDFYEGYTYGYNVPEFITGPVRIKARTLLKALTSPARIEVTLPVTSATPRVEEKKQQDNGIE